MKGGGECGLHYGGGLLSLYGDLGKAMAPHHGGCIFNLVCKGEVSNEGGVGELLGFQSVAKQCMVTVVWNQALEVSFSGSNPTLYLSVSDLSTSSDETAQCEGLDKIMISDDKEMYFQIGTQLPLPKKDELLNFLKGNLDFFCLECI